MGRPDKPVPQEVKEFPEWTCGEETLYNNIGLEKNIISSSVLSLDGAKKRLADLYELCPHTHIDFDNGETAFCQICQRWLPIGRLLREAKDRKTTDLKDMSGDCYSPPD